MELFWIVEIAWAFLIVWDPSAYEHEKGHYYIAVTTVGQKAKQPQSTRKGPFAAGESGAEKAKKGAEGNPLDTPQMGPPPKGKPEHGSSTGIPEATADEVRGKDEAYDKVENKRNPSATPEEKKKVGQETGAGEEGKRPGPPLPSLPKEGA